MPRLAFASFAMMGEFATLNFYSQWRNLSVTNRLTNHKIYGQKIKIISIDIFMGKLYNVGFKQINIMLLKLKDYQIDKAKNHFTARFYGS